MTFEIMVDLLKSNLAEETPASNSEIPPQATALLTDRGNVYVAVCRVFGSDCGYDNILTFMKTRGDETRILKMVTMWKDGGIDLSSTKFRESIYRMNNENLETEVMVFGKKHDNPDEAPLQTFVMKLKDTLNWTQ